jgi:hypothetical protein
LKREIDLKRGKTPFEFGIWAHFFARIHGQKNRAFRFNSSESAHALPVGFPLQSLAHGSSELCQGIACGNSLGS